MKRRRFNHSGLTGLEKPDSGSSRALQALSAFLIFALLLSFGSDIPAGNAEVRPELLLHVFSFGKADSFLFLADGEAVLIDCGLNGQGKEILSFLSENGISEIHTLILTHFDKDHVGGAAKVLKGIPVRRVLQSNCPKDSKEYEKYLAALALCSLDPITVRKQLSFSVGGAEFTVLPPEKDTYAKDPSNNSSLATLVTFGNTSLLFTGDAESARLQELVKTEFGKVSLLQIPHHGAWQTQLGALMDAVSPEIALITSSEEEPEDFVTLQLLEKFGTEKLLTREGELDIVSDGSVLSVYRNGNPIFDQIAPAA